VEERIFPESHSKARQVRVPRRGRRGRVRKRREEKRKRGRGSRRSGRRRRGSIEEEEKGEYEGE
jgi:hypothetical protein